MVKKIAGAVVRVGSLVVLIAGVFYESVVMGNPNCSIMILALLTFVLGDKL